MDGAVAEMVCAERHKNVDEKFDRDERRLNEHSREISELQRLTVEISGLAKQLAERSEKQDDRLAVLESKPGKRWDGVVGYALCAIISAAVTLGVTAIFK